MENCCEIKLPSKASDKFVPSPMRSDTTLVALDTASAEDCTVLERVVMVSEFFCTEVDPPPLKVPLTFLMEDTIISPVSDTSWETLTALLIYRLLCLYRT